MPNFSQNNRQIQSDPPVTFSSHVMKCHVLFVIFKKIMIEFDERFMLELVLIHFEKRKPIFSLRLAISFPMTPAI